MSYGLPAALQTLPGMLAGRKIPPERVEYVAHPTTGAMIVDIVFVDEDSTRVELTFDDLEAIADHLGSRKIDVRSSLDDDGGGSYTGRCYSAELHVIVRDLP